MKKKLIFLFLVTSFAVFPQSFDALKVPGLVPAGSYQLVKVERSRVETLDDQSGTDTGYPKESSAEDTGPFLFRNTLIIFRDEKNQMKLKILNHDGSPFPLPFSEFTLNRTDSGDNVIVCKGGPMYYGKDDGYVVYYSLVVEADRIVLITTDYSGAGPYTATETVTSFYESVKE